MTHPKDVTLNRRGILGGAAAAAAVAALAGLRPAKANNWRGLVGCVKLTTHSDSLEDLFKVLPPGIGILPVYMNFTKGTKDEMQGDKALPHYEQNIAYLASQQCDLISVEGAPTFMLMGRDAEAKQVQAWEDKYHVPMVTAPQNQVNALNAVKAKTIFGATPFSGDLNNTYASYFTSAGFNVTAMAGMQGVEFTKIQDVPSDFIYGFIKSNYLKTKGADAIYILGSALGALDIIEPLEQDLGVPVISSIAARAWEFQKRLHVHQPIKGFGTLLATLPA